MQTNQRSILAQKPMLANSIGSKKRLLPNFKINFCKNFEGLGGRLSFCPHFQV
ncbi:hypothetical protein AO385_0916 [Moraxella catarrhalis]|uniref:Uncharacterized protein n=1 Tax=Moraxella catarrhalis TaxID=480 RepID=A0A198US01_MORCA|nr:hypothetical protein AO384_1366 [Moraxella catarrhalis]OAU96940.1 hypothetical protein AO383_1264 [Moraxella catarrhalis]OAU98618.1 hypothetical protein AO383_0546 [Moraxella catarrhalis]OAU99126.1 hypothetical protein AO382_2148 [Moraxella catarrhalis]OAV02635.1 hypothetical protein AO385_0916 [Moraxella catarrhalis]